MSILTTVTPIFVGGAAGALVGIAIIIYLNSNGIYLGTIGAVVLGVVASAAGMAVGTYWGRKA